MEIVIEMENIGNRGGGGCDWGVVFIFYFLFFIIFFIFEMGIIISQRWLSLVDRFAAEIFDRRDQKMVEDVEIEKKQIQQENIDESVVSVHPIRTITHGFKNHKDCAVR